MICALSERLAAEDVRVSIAYGRRPETPADPGQRLSDAIQLIPLAWDRSKPFTHLRAGRALRQLVNTFDPDVIHLHSSFAGAVGALAAPRGVPTVYTPHAYAFALPARSRASTAILRTTERVIAHRVDMVGAVSRSEEELARGCLGVTNTVTVANGIPELDGRLAGRPGSFDPQNARVIAMGRMDPQRLPAETVRILSGMTGWADVLWIGGPKPGTGGEAPLVEASIPFTGWLPRPDVLAHVARASFYVHWTAWDGHPLAVLEAMAGGALVVARDIPVLREILPAEQLFSDPADAIRFIRSAIAHPEYYAQQLADQNRNSSRFGASRMAREWLDVYRSVLSSRRS
jgi:glycosyltransferase involved in cell wall biosynthesis